MGARSDVSRPRVLSGDPRRGCRVERPTEATVDRKRLRHRWWQLWQHEPCANRFGFSRCSLHDDVSDETVGRIDRNRSDRVPFPGSRCDEMQWLTRHPATNGDYGIRAQCGSAERQSNDGARFWAGGSDRDAGGLSTQRAGNEREQYSCCVDASSHGCPRVEVVSRKLTYGTATPAWRFIGHSAQNCGIEACSAL